MKIKKDWNREVCDLDTETTDTTGTTCATGTTDTTDTTATTDTTDSTRTTDTAATTDTTETTGTTGTSDTTDKIHIKLQCLAKSLRGMHMLQAHYQLFRFKVLNCCFTGNLF